ncbi:hypothetical protein DVH24_003600 [Malus domestica]|uniref:Brix domain-containing protein n=1 Tax=Malus domestica TaxID=3750 RepID=A0A498IM99_MALDO|nr:hypothetical protein DVH24_003600 [Malus domestica]
MNRSLLIRKDNPSPKRKTLLTRPHAVASLYSVVTIVQKIMGKKRKQSEAAVPEKKEEEVAPERPKRTLSGWKEKKDDDEVKPIESTGVFRNKEKVLVTCSRRISYRYRHLMLNVVDLMPHCKKDNKVDSKSSNGATLNELVELKNCSSCMFFECRKGKDLYLWMSKCPNGPSVKFLVNAVHTMEELKLTGNHLKGSRPILTFSSNFDKDAHWKLLKEMITQASYLILFLIELSSQIFGIPKEHRKSKPYHDHVFVFSIVDDHIWFRNYQISVPHNESDKIARGGLDKMTLVEIRTLEKKKKAGTFVKKVKAKTRRKMHELENPLEADEFSEMWKE